VREDGTLPLPLVDPVKVQGMSLAEATEAVRRAYTVSRQILKPGRERIIVTLMEPRRYSVLVVRQDSATGLGAVQPIQLSSGLSRGTGEIIGPRKRGTGVQLELPAYENDVLNALTRSGGLPGLDAQNEVLILRSRSRDRTGQAAPSCIPDAWSLAQQGGEEIIRIPLRLPPGAEVPVRPEDVILKSGDIVFIEARDSEVFYTGGILQNGQYPLPRDYDLDIVQAIALVGGPLVNGAFNPNNFSGSVQASGIGFPNPSLVSILRTIPGKGQINIRVDLNRALRDPRERILIQPKDLIILQSTPGEAMANYFTNIFQLNFLGTILRHRDAIATTVISVP
jgi:protein involved in polysaccharide export with SLBB domain